MTTTVIGIKDFRSNISKLAKEAINLHKSFIVTVRNKPIFEIKPCFNDALDLDETQFDYYKTLENSLNFWKSSGDDDIF